MKNNKLFLIAALLGTVLVGCQKEDIDKQDEQPVNETWILTVQATKDVDTKALAQSGNTLTASWELGEKVDVYFAGTVIGTLEVTDASDPATISGEVNVDGLHVGDELFLLFTGKRTDHKWDYLEQDGTIATIADKFDFASATLEVSSLENGVVSTTTSSTVFTNEQSIYRFAFKESGSAIAVESVVLTSSEDKLVRERTYGSEWESQFGSLSLNPTSAPSDNLYFMAIRNDNATSTNHYSFTAIGSDDNAFYEGTKDINVQLVNAKFYNANVSVSKKSFATSSGSVSTQGGVI